MDRSGENGAPGRRAQKSRRAKRQAADQRGHQSGDRLACDILRPSALPWLPEILDMRRFGGDDAPRSFVLSPSFTCLCILRATRCQVGVRRYCAHAPAVRGFSNLFKKVPVTRTGSLGDHDGTPARKYFSRKLRHGPTGLARDSCGSAAVGRPAGIRLAAVMAWLLQ
jgi:hypothetical protein